MKSNIETEPVDKAKKAPAAKQREKLEETFVDPSYGLNDIQVSERVAKGYVNTPVESPTKSVKNIILDNVLTYFNLIFILLALGLLLVGAITDMTFMIVVIINTAIGIIQEITAKKELDKLTILTEPEYKVIRNGEKLTLKTNELVKDDIVIFERGEQICADAVVISGNVRVNESLVTGESDEIEKTAGATLLSGSFIVSGNCSASLENVGSDSFVSKLTLEAKKNRKRAKGIMYYLDSIVKIIGILLIPIGIGLFLRTFLGVGSDIKTSAQTTTGALVGMIPEGLYLLADIALSVSVIKLARKKTLVHDMKCIETLARVDTLCVDKTGTITENDMTVRDVVPLDVYNCNEASVRRLMGDFVYNLDSDNITMKALKEEFSVPSPRQAVSHAPFSSVTKCSSVTFADEKTYVLGAPEFILSQVYSKYSGTIEKYASSGCRVLVFAEQAYTTLPLALILMQNKIRPEAKKTFSYFAEQGVDVKVISGDNHLTAAAIAAEAGIPNSTNSVDLSRVSDEDLEKTVLANTVFGRVTPEQKRSILKILKSNKHTVAMTGDGVNDILALKEADCSVALASGSDVASQVSQLVLIENNFAAMPHIVAEGRKVINNIERSASLFLVKNIFSIVMALVSIIFGFSYPLLPRQITLISALTIGLPGFFLALERNTERVKGNFIKNVIKKALPGALTDIFSVSMMVMMAKTFGWSDDVCRTMVTVIMVFVGIGAIYYISRPINLKRGILIGAIVTLFALAVILLHDFFVLSPIEMGHVLILVLMVLLIPSLMVAFHAAVGFVEKKIRQLIDYIKRKKAEAEEI